MSKPKLWTKDFIIVSTINFFLTIVFYLLIVIMGVYAVNEFNASISQAGLVTGIFIIGTLIGRLFIGRSIDSIGRKKTLFIGINSFYFGNSFIFCSFSVNFLLIIRFLHGITLGMASTATGTIVAQIIPTTRKGEGIGYYSMSATLATAIGPFIGLYMSQHTSFEMIFSLCLALGIISLITAFFVNVPALEVSDKTTEIKGFKISNFIEPKAIPIALITLVLAFCYSGVLSFINFYAREIDLVQTASFFFFSLFISSIGFTSIYRSFNGYKRANYIMYPAFIVFTAGMLLLSFAHNSLTLLLSGVLIGLGFGNMQSCTQAIAVKLTPLHRMGLATSTFFIFLDAGLGFGPYLLGFIIPFTSYSTLYAILGFVVLASTILYYLLHGKKERASINALAQ